MPIPEELLSRLKTNDDTLTKLNLSCGDPSLDDSDMEVLADALNNNKKLKILIISNNDVGDNGIEKIAKVLPTTNITKLIFDDKKINSKLIAQVNKCISDNIEVDVMLSPESAGGIGSDYPAITSPLQPLVYQSAQLLPVPEGGEEEVGGIRIGEGGEGLVAESNSEVLLKWKRIKDDMGKLNLLPKNDLRGKKRLAFEIAAKLIPLTSFIFQDQSLISEYENLSSRLPQYMNTMVEPIETAARTYFENLFSKMNRTIINITFTPKKSGIQLGRTMRITYTRPSIEKGVELGSKDVAEETQECMTTYYIKTHQHGSTSECSSVKPVDPKELFVYKVLEYIGYGPKAYFFFNPLSPGGFFIATQDMAFTKVVGKEKSFVLFDELKRKYNTTTEDPTHDEARKNLICLDI